MVLSELRSQLVQLSGRNDLALDSTVATSIFKKRGDFFIQRAIRWLDENVEVHRSVARYSKDMTVGSYRLLVPEIMALKSIYMQKSSTEIIELEKKSYFWIRKQHGESLSSISNGTPSHFIRSIPDLAPQQAALKTTDYTGDYTYEFGDTLFADESTPGSIGRYKTSVLLIVPPVDQTYTATVVGKFWSKVLFEDTDDNFWSVKYDDLVIQTALKKLEGFYRNSAGFGDWDKMIQDDLIGIEKSQIDEDIANVNEMEG